MSRITGMRAQTFGPRYTFVCRISIITAGLSLLVKPPSSIEQEQNTVTTDHEATTVKVVGRHDPSVVPRAVPVVEAMLANVLADLYLRNRAARLDWPS